MTFSAVDFPHRQKPFDHQRKILEDTWNLPIYALFWEQGCGKSKPILDNAALLYKLGEIDCLLVAAPNGVHRNWIEDEVPTHLIDEVRQQTHCFFYQTHRSGTKWHKQAVKEAINHKGLLIFAISYDAVMTEEGRITIWNILKKRRCFYTLDEATRIKAPRAKTAIRFVASGKYAPYRRILTGTPIANSPFDVYNQVKFLDENFWKKYELDDFSIFKNHFGIWKHIETEQHNFNKLVGFRRLEELHDILKTISSRLLKDDVLDLPPKLYNKRYFEFTAEQRRLYNEMRDEFMTVLDSGVPVYGELAIVRMLRLHQISRGYIPVDKGEPVHMIGEKNPCLDLMREIAADLPHPAIIWVRFQKDADLIMDFMRKDNRKAVRYDGPVPDDERARNKRAFQDGTAKFFVANPAAASEGLTLTAAKTVCYYSQDFNYKNRKQSEDRAHRIGQDQNVNYIDLLGRNDGAKTIDDYMVKNLTKKDEAASIVLGDDLKEWL